jgi:hypothetical protein
MNAVAYKTKDGLYSIAPNPGDDWCWSIRRLIFPPTRDRATWADVCPGDLCDILTREYRRTGERHQGFPVFEEV